MTFRSKWTAVLTLAMITATATATETPEVSDLQFIEGPAGLKLALHHVTAASSPDQVRRAVLLIHGATFPTALASGHRLDGLSWMDDLAARGFDVWALDFAGYGESERYPEMSAPADSNAPLLRASEAAQQVGVAVDAVLKWSRSHKISLVAHSWGTIPAGIFAASQPSRIDRLVLFGPVAPRRTGREDADEPKSPAHRVVSLADQWRSFQSGLPAGESSKIDRADFEAWGAKYLRTDASNQERTPPSVRVPFGPAADYHDARSGRFPYSPEGIRAPMLIVRGEWDVVTSTEDLDWFCRELSGSPHVAVSSLERGTHRMHLERQRQALFDEVGRFLSAAASPHQHTCRGTGAL